MNKNETEKEALKRIEEIRSQERQKREKQDNLEFEKSSSQFLRKKIKEQENRIEYLEDIVSQLIIIVEKTSSYKIDY